LLNTIRVIHMLNRRQCIHFMSEHPWMSVGYFLVLNPGGGRGTNKRKRLTNRHAAFSKKHTVTRRHTSNLTDLVKGIWAPKNCRNLRRVRGF